MATISNPLQKNFLNIKKKNETSGHLSCGSIAKSQVTQHPKPPPQLQNTWNEKNNIAVTATATVKATSTSDGSQ